MRLNLALQDNLNLLREAFGNSDDLIFRELTLGPPPGIRAAFIYIDGMADRTSVYRLIESLASQAARDQWRDSSEAVRLMRITVGDYRSLTDWETVHHAILCGETVILIDQQAQAFSVDTVGFEHRNITEPTSQTVVRGPQEGFTEALQTNITLIRRKIRDPNLWLEMNPVGRITKTKVAIMYMNGLVNETTLEEVRTRLQQIDIDGILESNYVEEFIQDKTYTVFPTINNSERPDVVAASLLEGRIAILVDGTPFVLMVPALFTQFLQSAEDYYHRSDFGLLRLIRYVAFFISLFGPSIYIAVTTFHQEMLPTDLLISLAAQREAIPFPAFIEALIMEITFELLREASIRMPRAIGTAISIVGALVLGQAAVEAGLVSPAMVIVVSITAIAGFIFPSFEIGISARILRFGFMGLAASFGFYGIFLGTIALVLHLCHLQSFGVPYMTPFAPFRVSDQKDNVIRMPWWKMYTRPDIVVKQNTVRTRDSGQSGGGRSGTGSEASAQKQKDEQ